ncbi:MAG: IS3 family transposase [Aeriscardovia sp.]|nr:IS3 family transposase [Aeriscardovia sp.]
MKYSFEIKKEIYEKHCEGYGGDQLSKQYGLNSENIRYMCRLIDKHGLDAIRHKFTKYSPEFKTAAINRVLEEGEAIKAVAIDLGLPGKSILQQWIKGDFNGTVDNLLLYKKVDTKKHRTKYIRDFSTSSVNEKWTTDVSEFHIAAGKLYLSPILDMHNREIVSYNISKNPGYSQITDMLNKAFSKYKDLSNLIFHSDQGWQYQMHPYHKALRERGITQSMSRKGNCLDNSPMENFFGKMKNEMFYGHEYEFETLEQLQKAMEKYIDYYNNERIQVKLKGLTPCQARNQSLYSV